jgi:hypothetical protein
MVISPGAPVVPVALNVTGEPVSEPDVATSELGPAVAPSVHDPAAAMPAEFVVAFPALTEPPPDETANVTATPATPLPRESVTLTEGGMGSAVPAAAN